MGHCGTDRIIRRLVSLCLSPTLFQAIRRVPRDTQFSVLGIGSSKVTLLCAVARPNGGMRGGAIVDLEEVVDGVVEALDMFRDRADLPVREVFIGISGRHVQATKSTGMVTLRSGEVTHDDVQRVLQTATAGCHLTDQQILHVLPQEFAIDKQLSVSQPVGMTGTRLDVRAHVVSVSVSAAQNLLKCARRCGLEPVGMVLHALASSNAVLSPDAREMGACAIDIGGGTTDAIVSGDNTVHYSL